MSTKLVPEQQQQQQPENQIIRSSSSSVSTAGASSSARLKYTTTRCCCFNMASTCSGSRGNPGGRPTRARPRRAYLRGNSGGFVERRIRCKIRSLVRDEGLQRCPVTVHPQSLAAPPQPPSVVLHGVTRPLPRLIGQTMSRQPPDPGAHRVAKL
ncbi:hypothetical protein EYF80_037961 [Liparis tanakae]|uniref:Uncharacterized protein n=1 Tax=Liparis tanakae TaxID=230148 RepID=A0A4Z2GFB6_9TELE|nr:hypothetical protein EYF80_037961 [Liparis tanakae]